MWVDFWGFYRFDFCGFFEIFVDVAALIHGFAKVSHDLFVSGVNVAAF